MPEQKMPGQKMTEQKMPEQKMTEQKKTDPSQNLTVSTQPISADYTRTLSPDGTLAKDHREGELIIHYAEHDERPLFYFQRNSHDNQGGQTQYHLTAYYLSQRYWSHARTTPDERPAAVEITLDEESGIVERIALFDTPHNLYNIYGSGLPKRGEPILEYKIDRNKNTGMIYAASLSVNGEEITKMSPQDNLNWALETKRNAARKIGLYNSIRHPLQALLFAKRRITDRRNLHMVESIQTYDDAQQEFHRNHALHAEIPLEIIQSFSISRVHSHFIGHLFNAYKGSLNDQSLSPAPAYLADQLKEEKILKNGLQLILDR